MAGLISSMRTRLNAGAKTRPTSSPDLPCWTTRLPLTMSVWMTSHARDVLRYIAAGLWMFRRRKEADLSRTWLAPRDERLHSCSLCRAVREFGRLGDRFVTAKAGHCRCRGLPRTRSHHGRRLTQLHVARRRPCSRRHLLGRIGRKRDSSGLLKERDYLANISAGLQMRRAQLSYLPLDARPVQEMKRVSSAWQNVKRMAE